MKRTITIGIPAYNEEANIASLLEDLRDLTLSKSYCLKEVLVISDGSSDTTVKIAKSFKWNKVKVVAGRKNIGKAARLNQIIKSAESDILVLLDADIRISDANFLSRLTCPIKDTKAEMSSAAIYENMPRSGFERALRVSMQLKSNLFCQFKNGDNIYNSHGPARAFVRKLYKQLNFTTDAGDDMYSYLQCVRLGKRFKFVDNTFVTYRLPATKKEHFAQSWRFNWSKSYYSTKFSKKFVRNEFEIPLSVFLVAGVKSAPILVRNISDTFYYVFLWLESLINKFRRMDISTTWNIGSTKEVVSDAK